jgi:protein-disulfide isomerase
MNKPLNCLTSSAACLLFSFIIGVCLSCAASSSASGEEAFLPSFGNGKIDVRLYTDYFCNPCQSLEPRIEHLLADLVKKNIITITFIDVPIHKDSGLYARYFLYILNDKRQFRHCVTARGVLFEGAKSNIGDKESLEEYLRKNGIKFKPFDVKPVLVALERLMKEDDVRATPTCVIYDGKKREAFQGPDDIPKALEKLR